MGWRREREGHEDGVVWRVGVVAGAEAVLVESGTEIKGYSRAIFGANLKLNTRGAMFEGPEFEGGKEGGCGSSAAAGGMDGDGFELADVENDGTGDEAGEDVGGFGDEEAFGARGEEGFIDSGGPVGGLRRVAGKTLDGGEIGLDGTADSHGAVFDADGTVGWAAGWAGVFAKISASERRR